MEVASVTFKNCSRHRKKLKSRKNAKCPIDWTLRVFSCFRNLLKNRGGWAAQHFCAVKNVEKQRKKTIFGDFVEMLKTEVSKRLDTSVFSISPIMIWKWGKWWGGEFLG